jgi:SAM-dependent methyltransferase
MPPEFQSGDILDYGCGQGLFLASLLKAGRHAFGCDIEIDQIVNPAVRSQAVEIQPWGFPPVASVILTVSILDVIEHHVNPNAFLLMLKNHGVRHIVCKVPIVEGPLYVLSTMLARFRIPSTLYGLYEVGDPAPHVTYFSRPGITTLFQKHGFRLRKTMPITEVGAELPRRMRTVSVAVRSMLYPFLWLAGMSLAALSTFGKSDSQVFYFSGDEHSFSSSKSGLKKLSLGTLLLAFT